MEDLYVEENPLVPADTILNQPMFSSHLNVEGDPGMISRNS